MTPTQLFILSAAFRRRIDQRARDIFQQLLMAGVGRRPIVWIAHSAGGRS